MNIENELQRALGNAVGVESARPVGQGKKLGGLIDMNELKVTQTVVAFLFGVLIVHIFIFISLDTDSQYLTPYMGGTVRMFILTLFAFLLSLSAVSRKVMFFSMITIVVLAGIFSLFVGLGGAIVSAILLTYAGPLAIFFGFLMWANLMAGLLLSNKKTGAALAVILLVAFVGLSIANARDYQIESEVRSPHYFEPSVFDFDRLMGECEKIVSPVSQKSCVGYVYFRRNRVEEP